MLLSYDMGVESSAILTRWAHEPKTRPCALDRLIVITTQVGDEYRDTGRDVEGHILPIMRAHGIRYVQVSRRGQEADGITVLDDSRNPQRLFLDGDYKLSDKLSLNGTVPQYGGVHRCALKFKAWVIERWLNENIRGSARHAIGYNCEERGRIAKSEYTFQERIAFGFNIDERIELNGAASTTRSREKRFIRCSSGDGRGKTARTISSSISVFAGRRARACTARSWLSPQTPWIDTGSNRARSPTPC